MENEFITQKKSKKGTVVVRRKGKYDIETKNTKYVSEEYLGKLIEKHGNEYIYVHGETLKRDGITYFLENNRTAYDAIISKYIVERSELDQYRDEIRILGNFLIDQRYNQFDEDEAIEWVKGDDENIDNLYFIIEASRHYKFIIEESRVKSICLASKDDDSSKQIQFIGNNDERRVLYLQKNRIKNYVLLSDRERAEIKAFHRNRKLELLHRTLHLYSDLRLSVGELRKITYEYLLVAEIVKKVESLLRNYVSNLKFSRFDGTCLYLVDMAYNVNKMIYNHVVDKGKLSIIEESFPVVHTVDDLSLNGLSIY
ncbi:MAG: hypothetical protein ACOWWR_08955 [Eubacteriales bacterium]